MEPERLEDSVIGDEGPSNAPALLMAAARDATKGGPAHHGGSHGAYMRHKINKLTEQFNANAAAAPAASSLFAGVSIYVNGHTSPSHLELKHIMAAHGGRQENYYSRGTVTHIICSNLPDAKVKQFERERDPTPVVTPQWITDSIAAGRRLPIDAYILWQLRGGPGQRSLREALQLHKPPGEGDTAGGVRDEAAMGGEAATEGAEAPPPPPQEEQACDPADLKAAQQVAARMRADCDVLHMPPRSTREDPNFVDTFYKASRLHFIGSWKARLEALMASTAAAHAPPPASYVTHPRRAIIHLDMDCFFASVAAAGRPELAGAPLAVSHSSGPNSSGEISSANYAARRFGVAAGMFVSRARQLCPALITVPYEFDRYEKVSEQVYEILLRHTAAVAPISCDEAFLDVTGLGVGPAAVAAALRAEIFAATGCTASAGIGPNMLLARLATKRAKPNGQTELPGGIDALRLLGEMPVRELPGVGWQTEAKLADAGLTTVAQVQASSKATLQATLGPSAGALLWDFAHGRDSRRVEPPEPRKSVGAEVNWGVRFAVPEEADAFLRRLAAEVAGRLAAAGMRGRTLTLKLKRKKPGWVEPVKFLGHGACDNLSRSVTLASATAAVEDIVREGLALLRVLRVPHADIRGMGLTVTRLESATGGGGAAKPAGGAIVAALAAMASRAQPSACLAVPAEKTPSKPTSQPAEGGARASESDAGWETGSGTPAPPPASQAATPGSKGPASARGTKRNSPGSGGKQVSLLELMPLPPATAGDAPSDEEEPGAGLPRRSARRELLAQYEGMTLTQIDARELAALPFDVQSELVGRLPRTRKQMAAGLQTGDVMEVERSGDGEERASKRSREDNTSKAPAVAAAAVGGSGPIETLPAPSEIDREVLEALPLALRSEIEAEYGIRRRHAAPAPRRPGRGGGGGGGRPSPPKPSRFHSAAAKSRSIDAFVVQKEEPAPAPLARRAAAHAAGLSGITHSQIDPAVLQELPEDVQREVMRQAQGFPTAKCGRRRTAAARAAAADRQRRVLETLHDAEAAGSSSDDEFEDQEALEGSELPAEVLQLQDLAASAACDSNALLRALDETLGSLELLERGEEENKVALAATAAAALRLGKLLVRQDLEATRRFLLGLQSLSQTHESFACYADALVAKLQRRVRRRYGWPLALSL